MTPYLALGCFEHVKSGFSACMSNLRNRFDLAPDLQTGSSRKIEFKPLECYLTAYACNIVEERSIRERSEHDACCEGSLTNLKESPEYGNPSAV